MAERCTAKNRRGEPCGNRAVAGGTKCRMHGGASLSGPEHPSFKHGRYSKHAPVRMLADLQAALDDPELMSVREQFAFVDALVVERIRAMGDESPAQLWEDVRLAANGLGELQDAVVASLGPIVTEETREAFAALDRWRDSLLAIVDNALGREQAEEEIREMFQEQRKLAEAEARREKALAEGITTKQLGTLVALIIDMIRRHVPQDDVRRAIQRDLFSALGHGGGEGTGVRSLAPVVLEP